MEILALGVSHLGSIPNKRSEMYSVHKYSFFVAKHSSVPFYSVNPKIMIAQDPILVYENLCMVNDFLLQSLCDKASAPTSFQK